MLIVFVGGRRRRLINRASAVSQHAYALSVCDPLLCFLWQGRQTVMAAGAGHNQPALQPVDAQNVPVVLHTRPVGQQ
jgi:hypothetical protein